MDFLWCQAPFVTYTLSLLTDELKLNVDCSIIPSFELLIICEYLLH